MSDKVALITGITGQDGGIFGRVPIENGIYGTWHQTSCFIF